ncbi:MAG: hypothetical protein KJ773_08320, partial [Candidatus Thermoplasmatota archaeon]|nr:hypothetical protein [Candidatus Thermoplasmatota archaeon]
NVVLWTTDPNSISIGSFATFQFAPSDEGTHIFRNIILCTAPSQVIGIHDLSDTQIQANMTIIVLPNAPSRLDIVPKESTILVGMFSPFSLRLLDEYGNIVPTSQILSVELTTTSSNGSFSPAGFMIFYEGTSETTFFYRETDTSGSPYQLTASALSLTVANALVHVVSSDANRWAVTPTYVELTAGESISFILQLQDAFGNPMNLTGDTLVNLTTTSRTGVFKYGDNIMESVVLKANTSSLELNYTDWNTANSPCFLRVNNGTYVADGFAVINITSTSPSQLAVSQSTTEAVAGTNVTIIAKVLDRYGNICVGLNGPIYLNTTDSLTSDQSRSLGDLNQDGLAFHVALYTVGVQTLTIECWGGTVKNTVIIRIKSGNVNSLELLMPDSVIAGTPFSGMAYVLDEYGNLASDYNGTISFTSDDPYPATLPSAYTFTHEDSGRHMFSDDFILFTIPERNITVQDEEVAWLNDTQNITIFDMTPPRAYFAVDNTSLVSGMRYNFTLDAWDDVYISKVTFYYSYDNTTFSSEEMNQSSGNISTGIGNYSVDMKLEEGTLHFYFFVSDGANQIHVYEGDDLPFSFTVKSNNNITHAIVLTLVIVFVSILLIIFYRSKTKRY